MGKVWQQNGNNFRRGDTSTNIDVLEKANYIVDKDIFGFSLNKFDDNFKFDYKIYGMESNFINRVIKTYDNTTGNLGILLNGQRGTGKSVTAKLICNSLDLPVIMITKDLENIENFLSEFQEDIIVFIDEYEKIFEERHELLSIMDGALSSNHRRLFILTTNTMFINENLLERPSRIRYKKTFKDLDKFTIEEIVDDLLENKELKVQTIEFISTLQMITVDIIKEVLTEVNIHNELPDKFYDIFNVSKRSDTFNISYEVEGGEFPIKKYIGNDCYFAPIIKDGETLEDFNEYNEGNNIYVGGKRIGYLETAIDTNKYLIKVTDRSILKKLGQPVDSNDVTLEILIEQVVSYHSSYSF